MLMKKETLPTKRQETFVISFYFKIFMKASNKTDPKKVRGINLKTSFVLISC